MSKFDRKYRVWNVQPDGKSIMIMQGSTGDKSKAENYGVKRIMQWIGWYDAEGREVYEGDILEEVKTGIRKVCAKSTETQKYVLKHHENDDKLTNHVWLTHEGKIDNHVVIGNIFENPELMEKTEKQNEDPATRAIAELEKIAIQVDEANKEVNEAIEHTRWTPQRDMYAMQQRVYNNVLEWIGTRILEIERESGIEPPKIESEMQPPKFERPAPRMHKEGHGTTYTAKRD